MDYVDKAHRGKWSAVEGLQSGVWSGTAAIGGWLIEAHGFRMNFFVMTMGFLIAFLLWLRVAWLVSTARRESQHNPGRLAVPQQEELDDSGAFKLSGDEDDDLDDVELR